MLLAIFLMRMTEVELYIKIRKEGNAVVDPEGVSLLRAIAETGSLITASAKVGISYNKAWKTVEAINRTAEKPLVEKLRGGNGGGGARITEYGYFILGEYGAIEKEVRLFTDKLNVEINI